MQSALLRSHIALQAGSSRRRQVSDNRVSKLYLCFKPAIVPSYLCKGMNVEFNMQLLHSFDPGVLSRVEIGGADYVEEWAMHTKVQFIEPGEHHNLPMLSDNWKVYDTGIQPDLLQYQKLLFHRKKRMKAHAVKRMKPTFV